MPTGRSSTVGLLANIHHALGDYAQAADFAQQAAIKYDERELSDGLTGPVRLTLAAALTRLDDPPRAKAAIADFSASVPGIRTITEIRRWIQPGASLPAY